MTSLPVAIDYVTTADMPDGQALPPYIDSDGAVWRVVCHLPDARTRWRRIRLAEQTTSEQNKDTRGRSPPGRAHFRHVAAVTTEKRNPS